MPCAGTPAKPAISQAAGSDALTSTISIAKAFTATKYSVVRVDVANPAGGWLLARLGYLPGGMPARVGVMACSPERARFRVTFTDYRCGPPIARDLHNGE